jgi:hypothetical protein
VLKYVADRIRLIEGVENSRADPLFQGKSVVMGTIQRCNIKLDTRVALCLITLFLKNNFVEVNQDEKNLSAKQYFTQAYPRFSGKDGHKEWSPGD